MAPEPDLTDGFERRRRRMVDSQIRGRGVSDPRILEAMENVARHHFVSERDQESAYEDRPLSIGEGQTISQPFIVARMAELAGIRPGDRVLEIGAGCGYAAAVYAELAEEVVAVEIRHGLAQGARRTLAGLGYSNVTVVTGTVQALAPAERFNRILAAAAADEIPAQFEERLAAGGRLVVPVGGRFSQHLWTVERKDDRLIRKRHEAVAFVPLV